MLKYFNDSTNNGKLYINYPMMQAYRNINKYPEEDIEFKDRIVAIKDCRHYKEIVNNQSCMRNMNKYNYPMIMKIIRYQLKKANYILNNNYYLPIHEVFNEIDLNRIYEIQYRKSKIENNIYVLNTFVFHLIEYNQNKTIDKIKEYN